MDDDFNSPVLISHLFNGLKIVNLANDGKESLTKEDLDALIRLYHDFVFDILGLQPEEAKGGQDKLVNKLMDTILSIRQHARTNKDFSTSDMIRDELAEVKITIKDTKDGAEWSLEE